MSRDMYLLPIFLRKISVQAWITSNSAFYNFQLLNHLNQLTQPVLFMAGENAETRAISESAYEAVTGQKELCIVPEANHVDLYDDVSKIPFNRLESFFRDNLQ